MHTSSYKRYLKKGVTPRLTCNILWFPQVNHDAAQRAIRAVIRGHKEGRTTTLKKKSLRAAGAGEGGGTDGFARPRVYKCTDTIGEPQPEPEPSKGWTSSHTASTAGVVQRFPPADDARTLTKFYTMTNDVVTTFLSDAIESGELDWPFRPDEREAFIIKMNPKPARSILLVGRSGTGKTTIAVHRMWARYKDAVSKQRERGETPGGPAAAPFLRQCFVTANPVLLDTVRTSFNTMRQSMPAPPGAPDAAAMEVGDTLQRLGDSQFPLFLSSTRLMHMLDGTCPKPFFPRDLQGRIKEPMGEDGMHSEEGALSMLPQFDDSDNSDDWEFESDEDFEDATDKGDASSEKGGGRRKMRIEVSYAIFAQRIWPQLAAAKGTVGGAKSLSENTITKAMTAAAAAAAGAVAAGPEASGGGRRSSAADLAPSVVWTEITSYIKGSLGSLDTECGFLSEEEYVALPRKMAPACYSDTGDMRRRVYKLFQVYEKLKSRMRPEHYDACDLSSHVSVRPRLAECACTTCTTRSVSFVRRYAAR